MSRPNDPNVMEVHFDNQSTISTLSSAQEDALKLAREKALQNRAVRALSKAESRVAELKQRLGIAMVGLSGDQINRVGQLFAETVEKYEKQRNTLIEDQSRILAALQNELRHIRKSANGTEVSAPTSSARAPVPVPTPTASRTTLSQVGSSVSRAMQAGDNRHMQR